LLGIEIRTHCVEMLPQLHLWVLGHGFGDGGDFQGGPWLRSVPTGCRIFRLPERRRETHDRLRRAGWIERRGCVLYIVFQYQEAEEGVLSETRF